MAAGAVAFADAAAAQARTARAPSRPPAIMSRRSAPGNAKPSLPRARSMRNMDKRQHRHCFLSAHFAELSWGKESTIYVPPTTPTLMSRVRYLPPSGRSRSTIPDDSRRSPMLNLRYQELGQCATWIKGSTNTAFYPRILPNYHGARKVRSTFLRLLRRSCPGFDTCLSQAGPGRQFPTIPDAPQC